MRVDLDTEDINLEALPRFQRAAFHAQRLLTLATRLGGLALALLSLLAIMGGWNLSLSGASLGQAGYLAGGTTLLATFGVLVLERSFAGVAEAECPKVSGMARLASVAIVILLLASLCLLTSASNELIRRCLLRWQDERLAPAFRRL